MGLVRFAFAESEENLCVYSFHNFRIIIVILSAGIIRPKCVVVVAQRWWVHFAANALITPGTLAAPPSVCCHTLSSTGPSRSHKVGNAIDQFSALHPLYDCHDKSRVVKRLQLSTNSTNHTPHPSLPFLLAQQLLEAGRETSLRATATQRSRICIRYTHKNSRRMCRIQKRNRIYKVAKNDDRSKQTPKPQQHWI